jgi:hypothetical protein
MALSIHPTHVFWCEPTGKIRRWLRCYQPNDPPAEVKDVVGQSLTQRAEEPMPRCTKWCCNAMKLLDEVDEEGDESEGVRKFRKGYDAASFPWDAFPLVCEDCKKEMTAPKRQIFCDEIYVVKTGERAGQTFCRRELPVGAMLSIECYSDIPDWCGRDGLAINVVTPGGEWHIDGKANNCTKPDDHAHRCWVRRGDPRTGYLHVDKDATIQETCEAGAGSIWINQGGPRDWHGFLHRGYLVDADGEGRSVVDRLIDAGNPVAPAERAISPVRADMAKVRRTIPRRPEPKATPAGTPTRRWRSNR